MSFEITSKTGLNALGKTGAVLLIGSQVIGALAALSLYASPRLSEQTILGLAALSVIFVIGAVLLFVGRTYTHSVRKIEDAKPLAASSIPAFGGTEKERQALGLG